MKVEVHILTPEEDSTLKALGIRSACHMCFYHNPGTSNHLDFARCTKSSACHQNIKTGEVYGIHKKLYWIKKDE